MDVWYFTEQSHAPSWDKFDGHLRVDMPNRYQDPAVTSRLLNEYLDQYVLADQLGMNCMVNEHHTAATCMSISVTLTLAMLARQTKNARLLGLGSIISNRPDPVRVAEEYAMVDSISGGRLEMGLVKGAGWELFASNANPVDMMDRFWEAHDLILKAMSTEDEVFSWEGEHFDYRAVTLWPRAVQQPHPPIWMPASSPGSGRLAGERGYRVAGFLLGYAARPMFEAYKKAYVDNFGHQPLPDRLSYMGIAVAGRKKEDIERRVAEGKAYLASVARMPAATLAPPGYGAVGDFAKLLRSPVRGKMGASGIKQFFADGSPVPADPSADDLARAGVMFWGEPERMLDQILEFNENIGGLGHLMIMGQCANMSHEDTCDSLRLIGEHIVPELKKIDKFAAPKKEAVPAE